MTTGMNWTANPAVTPAANHSFEKLTSIANPGPSQACVFIDEAGNSIDNNVMGIHPGFVNDLTGGVYAYWNPPSNRHNNGAVLGFADGHAESWKWQDHWIADANAKADSGGGPIGPSFESASDPGDRDLKRLKLTVPPWP